MASVRLWKIGGGLEASVSGRSYCLLHAVVAVVGVTAREWDDVYTPVGRTRRMRFSAWLRRGERGVGGWWSGKWMLTTSTRKLCHEKTCGE